MRLLRSGKCHVTALLLAAAVGLTGVVPVGFADHPINVKAGHSVHGDTFDEGPRRATPPIAGTGEVTFAVTTRSPEAQQFFNQGIGQLHGFWWLEAERSFRHAAAIDPTCPMAYWGMAMANYKNPKRAKVFIDEASHRMTRVEVRPIEQAWIKALSAMYMPDDKVDNKRKKAFVDELGKIQATFSDDVELKAFRVFFMWEYKTGTSETGKLLDEIFAANPRHPAHHYRIHLNDYAKAKNAIQSAAMCGPVAPGIAHMWHMPGHTYSSLQRYADAAWQQEASARVDHAYMMRDRVMPYEIHNYAHNNEWLIRDLLFVGRVKEAIDLAKNMIELPRHPKFGASTNRGSGAEYGYERIIDTLSQHQMWEEYLRLCDTGYLPAGEGKPEHQLRRLRFKGVAHAALGQTKDAEAIIAEIRQMKAKAPPATQPATRPASTPGVATTKPAAAGAMVAEATQAAPATKPASPATSQAVAGGRSGRGTTNNAGNFDRAIEHIEGQLALTAKDYPKALRLLTTAGVRQDHMALAHLASGDKVKAVDLAKKAADSAKGQTYPLAVCVNVLMAAGKKDEAKKSLESLRDLAFAADLDIEPYKSIGKAAGELGVSAAEDADWRATWQPAKDLGERPPLDQLGPFRWSPWDAPAFSAPAADDSAINLDSFKGRPVVVIFYLGFGCLHCTQQLAAFAPLAREYNDAGISLVAISTDDRDSLHKAWDAARVQEAGQFPFPLAADPKLEIFKRYGCYDDFEKSPIHGTFLIDGQGKIRWQDISADPFMDGAFLLKEAKRLLGV